MATILWKGLSVVVIPYSSPLQEIITTDLQHEFIINSKFSPAFFTLFSITSRSFLD